MLSAVSAKRVTIVAVLLGLIVVGATFIPIQPILEWLVLWSDQAGPAAMALYVVVFVALAVFLLPAASVLIGLAGLIFGFGAGLALTIVANLISCWIQWVLGSGLLRRWVQGQDRFSPALEAVEHAIHRDAFKVVLLSRFSLVVPFGVLNMACGAARVPLRPYVVASILGLAPAAVAYSYLGTLADGTAQLLTGPTAPEARLWQLGGLVIGAVSTLLLLWWTQKIIRGALSAPATSG